MPEYKGLRNEVQQRIRVEKNIWFEDECNALDQYDRTGKARQLFAKVREVKTIHFRARQACINDAHSLVGRRG